MSIKARPTILFATATALALSTCGATSSPLHARRERRFLVRGRVDRRFLYPPQRSDPCSDVVALVLQEGRPALADDGVRQVPAHRGVDEGEPAEPRRHSRDRQDPATEPRRHAHGALGSIQKARRRHKLPALLNACWRRRGHAADKGHGHRRWQTRHPRLEHVRDPRPGPQRVPHHASDPGLVPCCERKRPTLRRYSWPRGCSSPEPPGARSSSRC